MNEKKLKQTNASAHLVRYRFRSMEAVWKDKSKNDYGGKDFAKEMSFKSGVKDRGKG